MSFGPVPDLLLFTHSFGQIQPSPAIPMTRSPRELANQKIQIRKQQETLLRDLLSVVDALDRAADHWQQAEAKHQDVQPVETPPLTWWQRGLQRMGLFPETLENTPASENLAEVVSSAREGIDLIRESMLTVLNQHQVIPIPAQGQPFDPNQMNALGQQPDTTVPPNTVVQEVVRGYRWQDRMLREAQVIVAAAPPAEHNPES
jgi:molecular chaperone GrpE